MPEKDELIAEFSETEVFSFSGQLVLDDDEKQDFKNAIEKVMELYSYPSDNFTLSF